MYNNTKKIILAVSVLCSTFASAYATDMVTSSGVNAGNVTVTDTATTAGNVSVNEGAQMGAFAMQEVKVQDLNTIKIVFNRELLEDTSMFEFLLTSKKDDTKEIVLTGITLSSSTELTATTMEALVQDEEYNLVVVFASDKDGNVIENGVDGMITFKALASTPSTETTELNAATETVPEMMPTSTESQPTDMETPALDAAAPTTDAGVSPEAAAGTAETLPQTGPKEVMIVILAMLLGLGFMYVRQTKKA